MKVLIAICLISFVCCSLGIWIGLRLSRNIIHRKKAHTLPQPTVDKKEFSSLVGKTRTDFESMSSRISDFESKENENQPSPTFAHQSQTPQRATSDNDALYTDLPEEETDEIEEEMEEIALLLQEDISLSQESLTQKDLRQLKKLTVDEPIEEDEHEAVLSAVEKVRGTDFWECFKAHESVQRKLESELMTHLKTTGKSSPQEATHTDNLIAEDWMQRWL